MKINLLVIQQSPDWGGAEEWMTQLLYKIIIQNHIRVYGATNLPKMRKKWSEIGVHVESIPVVLDIIGNWKGLVKSVLAFPVAVLFYVGLLHRAKKRGVNCILMSGFSEKILVTWLAKIFSIPVVWYEYGPLQTVFKRNFHLPKFLYLLTKSLPKKIITISQNTKTSLLKDAFIEEKQVDLVYPGVEIPDVVKRKKSLRVGTLSRVAEEKGQRFLLKIWPEVLKQVPEASLSIAGRGPDFEYLDNKVKKNKLSSSVSLVGFVENKSEYYNSLDVFVFCGSWKMEGFGLVLAEAMSFGVPVVCFDQAPMSEVVGSAGEKVSVGSENQFIQSIVTLLQDRNTQKELGDRGRLRVKKSFNINIQSNKIYQILQEVVDDKQ